VNVTPITVFFSNNRWEFATSDGTTSRWNSSFMALDVLLRFPTLRVSLRQSVSQMSNAGAVARPWPVPLIQPRATKKTGKRCYWRTRTVERKTSAAMSGASCERKRPTGNGGKTTLYRNFFHAIEPKRLFLLLFRTIIIDVGKTFREQVSYPSKGAACRDLALSRAV
jgi:hypothetical protein